METMIDRIDGLQEQLGSRAFLFDHPADYQEGVSAAIEAVRAILAPTLIRASA